VGTRWSVPDAANGVPTRDPDHRSGPTRPPSLAARAGLVLRFPLGMAVTSFRYLWRVTALHRTEVEGDPATNLPPVLPAGVVDDEVKPIADGRGPLFHRFFAVSIRDADRDAAGLMAKVTDDLDAAAPSEVVSFRKTRGEPGHLVVGDEYRVRMPGPWDGPVRVVHRDATSFRFVTLAGHLEAGQIEFRARDTGPGRLRFEIEAWSRAGDAMARLLHHRLGVGKEIQLNMWVSFCLSTPKLAGGRRDSGITIDTRRIESDDLPEQSPDLPRT
jgi:hypothetical protein